MNTATTKALILAAVAVATIAAVVGTQMQQVPIRRVSSIAELRQLDPRAFMASGKLSVFVEGYYEPGDDGGGMFTLSTNVLGDDGGSRITCTTAGYEWHAVNRRLSDIRRWGATSEDQAFDNGPVITAASLYQSTRGGGLVYVPEGLWWQSNQVTLYPKTILRGVGTTFTEATSSNTNSALYAAGGASWLRRVPLANQPQIVISTNGGYFKQQPTLSDGSSNAQFYVNVIIDGIMFDGNVLAQTVPASTIVAKDAWNIRVQENAFVNFSRHAFESWNCNAVRFHENDVVDANYRGRAAFWGWDLGDGSIKANWIFGGQGPRIRLMSLGSHKNLIEGNLVGNSVVRPFVTITNIASGLFTSDTNHNLWTGDAVSFTTATNPMPSGLASNSMHFVIRVSDTTFRVHTNHVLAESGTYLSPGSIPLGSTLVASEGRACLISFEDQARRTAVTDNRFDQSSGSLVVLDTATGVICKGNVMQESPFDTAFLQAIGFFPQRPAAAFHLLNDAFANTVSGNSGAGHEIGVLIESGARYNSVGGNTFESTATPFSTDTELGAQQNVFWDFAMDEGVLRIGSSNAATAARFIGGKNAQTIIKALRMDTGHEAGLRVVNGGWQFTDEDAGLLIGQLYVQGSDRVLGFSDITTTPGRSWLLGVSPTNGTINGQSGAIVIAPGPGTGNATAGNEILLLTADPTASGTSAQTASTKWALRGEGHVWSKPKVSAPTLDTDEGGLYYDSTEDSYMQRTLAGWMRLENSSRAGHTGNELITNDAPRLVLYDSNESANHKRWDFLLASQSLIGRIYNDDGTVQNPWLQVIRSTTNVSSVNLIGASVQANSSPIWTVANDGAGSGLDADLLDGQSSAYYLARANHTGTQSYTTITGLGDSATRNVGTTAGTVAAGDDPRFGSSTTYTAGDGIDITTTVISTKLVAGPNVTLSTNGSGVITIEASTASGGSGTEITVDGGSALTDADWTDTATVDVDVSGSTVTAEVVADSLSTNHLAAGTESYFLARANHTGTQTRSTISDFAHASTHQSGGSDAIKLDDLATPDDNTDLNATSTRHGLLPKLSGSSADVLRGDGTFGTPPTSTWSGVKLVTTTEGAVTGANLTDESWHALLGTVRAGTSATFAAGTLAAGDVLHVRATGRISAEDGFDDAKVRFKLGDLSVTCTFDEYESYGISTDGVWTAEAWFTVTTAGDPATTVANGHFDFHTLDDPGSTGSAYFMYRARGVVSGSLDTTTDATLSVDFNGKDNSGSQVTAISCTHAIALKY